jgi:hypothetical protein
MKHKAILLKDARHLLLPWSLVTAGALLSFVHFSPGPHYWGPSDFSWIVFFGAFLGVPLLAASVYGHEFQHGTMTLLLSQPIQRRDIWTQKLLISFLAVAPPTILYSISSSTSPDFEPRFWLVISTWALVATLSAPFWNFGTKSTIGAWVLNAGVSAPLWFFGSYCERFLPKGARIPLVFPWPICALAFAYAGVTLWLGRRLLLRYQAQDGVVPVESALPGSRFIPLFLVDLFRAKRKGAIANLIRKELWLLRLVWALGIVCGLGWALLVALHIISLKPTGEYVGVTAAVMCLSILIAMLAGALSMGEERTGGTHAWHMTLPVSATTQWAIKLGVALFSSLVCGALLPTAILIIHGRIAGSTFGDFQGIPLWLGPLEVALLTLLAFWCASIVKGTVRAVLWVFPIPVALGLCFGAGAWITEHVITKEILWACINRFDPTNSDSGLGRLVMSSFWFRSGALFFCVLVPLVATGLFQSRRRFTLDSAERRMRILSSAIPLLAISLIFGAVFTSMLMLQTAWYQSRQAFLRDVHVAVQELESRASGQDPASPQRFSAAQVEALPALQKDSIRWLRGASITVTPNTRVKGAPTNYDDRHQFLTIVKIDSAALPAPYTAVVHLADNRQCDIWFYAPPKASWGKVGATCN